MKQTIDWTYLLQTGVGIFFSILLGFFVLQLAIAALNLATSYGEKDSLKKFKDTFTSAFKGLIIAVGGVIIVRTIFNYLNISGTGLNDPLSQFSSQMRIFENCIRNYNTCGIDPKAPTP